MKDGDAKLQGLMFYGQCQPVTEHEYSCDLCQPIKGGFHVLRNVFINCMYYWHLIQYRHHELLQQDCLSEELKTKLRIKAIYHNSKVVELGSQI